MFSFDLVINVLNPPGTFIIICVHRLRDCQGIAQFVLGFKVIKIRDLNRYNDKNCVLGSNTENNFLVIFS